MTLTYPYRYHPQDGVFSGAWHADWSVANPSFLVATMAPPTTFDPSQSGFSTDGGYTWTPFPTLPLGSTNAISIFGIGEIHVGNTNNIVWIGSGNRGGYHTTDTGATWNPLVIPGVTNTTLNTVPYFYYRRICAADKTTADIFYLYANGVGFFKSVDGGTTWVQTSDNSPWTRSGYYNDWTGHAYLKAVPGFAGHLFFTAGFLGTVTTPVTNVPFMRSTDGGTTWTSFTDMKSVRGFGFGKVTSGGTYPTIYVYGILNGTPGIYRSVDNCATWGTMGVTPMGSLDFIRNIDGDKDTFGKFYLTTQGSGLIVGQIS